MKVVISNQYGIVSKFFYRGYIWCVFVCIWGFWCRSYDFWYDWVKWSYIEVDNVIIFKVCVRVDVEQVIGYIGNVNNVCFCIFEKAIIEFNVFFIISK